MTVAAELKRARENQAFSLEELSARTKVSVERLAAIETADIDQLPPVTYLRGFLRAYATEVGLDPDDISTRYVAQFQQEAAFAEFESEDALADGKAEPASILELDGSLRSPIVATPPFRARRVRRSGTPYAWLAIAAGVAVFAGYLLSANLDSVSANLDRLTANLGSLLPSRTTRPSTADARIVEQQQPSPARPLPSTPKEQVPSAASPALSSAGAETGATAAHPAPTLLKTEPAGARGTVPQSSRATGGTSASMPPNADAGGEVTSPSPARAATPPTSNQPNSSPAAAARSRAASNDRTPTELPDRSQPPATDRSRPAATDRGQPTVTDPSQPAATDRSQPVATIRGQPAVTDRGRPAITDRGQTATVEPDAREQRRVEPETSPSPRVANDVTGEAPADDVTGSWTMINQIESTSYNRFRDLKLGYRLQLEQSGNRVTGYGMKWMENGREIASNSRTPIMVEGLIEGRRLELRFTERGSRRASGGMFLMQLADDGSLHGSFTSDAARSSGSSQARRVTAAR